MAGGTACANLLLSLLLLNLLLLSLSHDIMKALPMFGWRYCANLLTQINFSPFPKVAGFPVDNVHVSFPASADAQVKVLKDKKI